MSLRQETDDLEADRSGAGFSLEIAAQCLAGSG